MKTVCRVKKMSLEDIKDVIRLENLCFAVPWSEEAFVKELTQNELAHYTVILLDDVIVGYGGAWYIMDEGHITNIAVDPSYRKQGLGQKMVHAMKEEAIENKMACMTLEVRKSNIAAIKLYEKLGFTIEGIRPKYYTDNQEDALIMWVDLEINRSEALNGNC